MTSNVSALLFNPKGNFPQLRIQNSHDSDWLEQISSQTRWALRLCHQVQYFVMLSKCFRICFKCNNFELEVSGSMTAVMSAASTLGTGHSPSSLWLSTTQPCLSGTSRQTTWHQTPMWSTTLAFMGSANPPTAHRVLLAISSSILQTGYCMFDSVSKLEMIDINLLKNTTRSYNVKGHHTHCTAWTCRIGKCLFGNLETTESNGMPKVIIYQLQ